MCDGLFFADICVSCGAVLPEGEIICNNCKKIIKEKNLHKNEKAKIIKKSNKTYFNH